MDHESLCTKWILLVIIYLCQLNPLYEGPQMFCLQYSQDSHQSYITQRHDPRKKPKKFDGCTCQVRALSDGLHVIVSLSQFDQYRVIIYVPNIRNYEKLLVSIYAIPYTLQIHAFWTHPFLSQAIKPIINPSHYVQWIVVKIKIISVFSSDKLL